MKRRERCRPVNHRVEAGALTRRACGTFLPPASVTRSIQNSIPLPGQGSRSVGTVVRACISIPTASTQIRSQRRQIEYVDICCTVLTLSSGLCLLCVQVYCVTSGHWLAGLLGLVLSCYPLATASAPPTACPGACAWCLGEAVQDVCCLDKPRQILNVGFPLPPTIGWFRGKARSELIHVRNLVVVFLLSSERLVALDSLVDVYAGG